MKVLYREYNRTTNPTTSRMPTIFLLLNTTNFLVVYRFARSTAFYNPTVFTLTDCIRPATTAVSHE